MEGNASPASTSNSNNSSISGDNGSITVSQSVPFRLENPFTFKVGQVFTGFGVGCGLGIGVGRPLNLGAIPMLSQVMSAASGATQAFSGVGRHVNSSLKKIGAKNVQAGIGCGVGFGHGFGVGLAVKPGVVNKIQMHMLAAMTKLVMKFGAGSSLTIDKGALPASLQSGIAVVRGSSSQDPLGVIAQFEKNISGVSVMNQDQGEVRKVDMGIGSLTSESAPANSSFAPRTEKLINSFLQDPVLRGENSELHKKDGQLQSENKVLRMVIKHQQVIEELMEENERLRQILVEDLKVPPSKLRASSGRHRSPCTDCFECRRKERRR